MITVNDVVQWHQMKDGVAVEFANRNPRICTLDFNVAGTTNIYILVDGEKDARLLAHVTGRETVKFAVPGAYRIVNKDAAVDAWVYSRDSSKVHRVALDEETYTTLHEPRARDENLERIIEKMNRGVERRLAAQQAQFERELSVAREKLSAASAGSNEAQPVVAEPKPSEPVGKPDEPAPPSGE